jgi:glycosyltransferase involved in cell wall biosynthesis
MPITPVLVADAGSIDGTPDVVLGFRDRLNVQVVPGGLPSVGRNRGAAQAQTPYVLFIDADIELADTRLIRRSVERMRRKDLHLCTTNILCRESRVGKVFYYGNNFFQYLSRLGWPFATGMFMMFSTERFRELGGFHEQVLFAEDYLLAKKVARKKFCVVRGGVYATNRRFEKMGYGRVTLLFFRTAFHTFDEKFFLRDHKYWAY